ncbi:MAG: NnrU family protein [Candidatus Hodarchaeota archaeon]
MLVSWINLLLLFFSLAFFAGFYIPSLQPARRAETAGNKAWKQCKTLRTIGTIFMVVALITIFLWIWLPIPELAWSIHSDPWIGSILAVIIFIITFPIWLKGLKDSGPESITPSPNTKMFRGIYQYIRHPQTLGEISWFIALPLLVNSFFLLIVTTIFLLFYTPTMLYVEERDLIRRFGDAYREYKEQTGALFPKFRKAETEPNRESNRSQSH